jgi:hypothetical protein
MRELSTPLVSDLLASYVQNKIDLEKLSLAFNQWVRWDYDFLFPEDRTKVGNTWDLVHNALLKGEITSEAYLFLTKEYEVHISNKAFVEYSSKSMQ